MIDKNSYLQSGERIDDLQQNGLSIIQKKEGFSFGIDSVLIANFCQVKNSENVIDIGTGTGIIPILINAKSNPNKIIAVEIQEKMAEMASRSIQMNCLEDKIKIECQDIREYSKLNKGKFNVVVSNPPYFKAGAALISDNDSKMISRHEIKLNIDELFDSASKLLCPKGRFYLIHRPDRLVDIFVSARKYNLEVKKAKMVYSKLNTLPKLIILECIKGANSEIKWQKPLIIYQENGDYTQDIYSIYQSSSITSFSS